MLYAHGIDVSTSCCIIPRVSKALARRKNNYVHFTLPEYLKNIKQSFYDIDSIPYVFGAIDGTHIRISSPGGDEAGKFINRKGFCNDYGESGSEAHKESTDNVR